MFQPEPIDDSDLKNSFTLEKLKVKVEARDTTMKLVQNMGGVSKQDLSSKSIFLGLKMKTQETVQEEVQIPSESDINGGMFVQKIRDVFESRNQFELPTNEILAEFQEYIGVGDLSEELYKSRIDAIKGSLKKVAFFDKSNKLWILKD